MKMLHAPADLKEQKNILKTVRFRQRSPDQCYANQEFIIRNLNYQAETGSDTYAQTPNTIYQRLFIRQVSPAVFKGLQKLFCQKNF